MEKTKRRLDESIVRRHPVYKSNDLVNIKRNTKQNKLEASWRAPYEVIDYLDNNNLRIRNKDKIVRTHIDQVMPYFTDDHRINKVHFSIITDLYLIIKYPDSYLL